MTTRDRIIFLIDKSHEEQNDFAESIGVSGQVVSKWRAGLLRSYDKYIGAIADHFQVPVDFLLGVGPFADWDPSSEEQNFQIVWAFNDAIPPFFKDDTIDTDSTLIAWIDKSINYNPGVGDLSGFMWWLQRSVSRISFDGEKPTAIVFLPYYAARMTAFSRTDKAESPRTVNMQSAYSRFILQQLISTASKDEPEKISTLLKCYYSLNEEGREKLLDSADDLVCTGKYIKNNPSKMGETEDVG